MSTLPQSLRDSIANLLAQISKLATVVPLSDLIALAVAATPLPNQPDEVRGWLTRVGIMPPAGTVAEKVLCKILDQAGPLPLADFPMAAIEAHLEAVAAEQEAAGAINPAFREMIVNLAKVLIQMWLDQKKNRV